MPQLVANMNVRTLINIGSKLKMNSFKLAARTIFKPVNSKKLQSRLKDIVLFS